MEEGEKVLREWENEKYLIKKRRRLEEQVIEDTRKVDYLGILMINVTDVFIDDFIDRFLQEYSIKLPLLSKKYKNFFASRDWTPNIQKWYLSHSLPSDLAIKNLHPRDYHIFFIPGELHRYTVVHWDDCRKRFRVHMSSTTTYDNPFASVTTFYKPQFPEFDAHKIIGRMMRSRTWHESIYYGMTEEEILKLWADKRDLASKLGSLAHENIEHYYNGRAYDPHTPEFVLFMRYKNTLSDDIVPFRTEWMIYDTDDDLGKGLCLFGSIDMVYGFKERPFDEYGRRRVRIVDWKRSENIKMSNSYEKGLSDLTKEDDACNFVKYSYQVKTYTPILERKYNCIVEGLDLVIIHPKQTEPIIIDVPFNRPEIERIVNYRRHQLFHRLLEKWGKK